MKIYQLVSFVNAYNKRTKKWESLHNVTKVFVGKEGLKTAFFEFEKYRKERDKKFESDFDREFKRLLDNEQLKNENKK